MRSMISSGMETRSSFFMNSALRALVSGQMPATTGMRQCSIFFRNSSSRRRSNTGWVTAQLGAGLDFVLEAANFLVDVGGAGIGAHGDHEPGGSADGIAANVEPAVQVVDDVDQSDGIHVEDRGGVGIVAHLRRIAGDADQVADADGAGAQQVRLNAQHVAVAAGVVQDGLDADLLRISRHSAWLLMRAEARGLSGMLTASTPTDFRKRAPSISLAGVDALGRNDLDHGDELAVGDLASQSASARGAAVLRRAAAWQELHAGVPAARAANDAQEATSCRECGRAWCRSIRRPGARRHPQTCGRSSAMYSGEQR